MSSLCVIYVDIFMYFISLKFFNAAKVTELGNNGIKMENITNVTLQLVMALGCSVTLNDRPPTSS